MPKAGVPIVGEAEQDLERPVEGSPEKGLSHVGWWERGVSDVTAGRVVVYTR